MSNPQHEPTMEEILASIRKIISEDSSESASAPQHAAADADVLELTQEVSEERVYAPEPVHAPAPEPVAMQAPAPEPAPAPMPEPEPEHDIVFEPVEEAPVPTPAPAFTASDHSDIFSEKSRKAVDDVFARLDEHEPVRSTAQGAAAPIAPADSATVQAVFEHAIRESFDPVLRSYLSGNADAMIERMKPLIREWMDEHFPALLEGAVRNEVARVVKARGR